MAVDNFIDVGVVYKTVPSALGINHGHRPGCTTVKTAGFVHSNLARPRKTEALDA
jgi:hypothetical protein